MKYLKYSLAIGFSILVGYLIIEQEPAHPGMTKGETKKARTEYFFNKLKDPVTGEIPENVRINELAFAARLRDAGAGNRSAGTQSVSYDWAEIGPSDVGGRTRALAQDFRDGDVVLAGGVSGGIWKSENGGQTWTQKLPLGSHLSITSIAQDTISGNTWYATSGEIADGGSARGKFGGNFALGIGIYKSLDNGETWELMTYGRDPSNSQVYLKQSSADERISSLLRTPFNLTSKVFVANFSNPTIFVTTQYFGILISQDGGDSFSQFGSALTNGEEPTYTDAVVDKDGVITLWFGPTDSGNNGMYRSYDGGSSYSNVTPTSYATMSDGARGVLAISKNNPERMYAIINDGSSSDLLYTMDFSALSAQGGTFTSADLSVNLPEFSRSIFGGTEKFSTQGGYDMTIAVHPDDPDFVLLGYVNLVKSTDGFSTAITSDPAKSWIGGNENPFRQDEGLDFDNTHHADQHIVFFDQDEPNTAWSGHDGGISKTVNISADRVIWESLNNDYNITQFYTISASNYLGDSYVIGGTQDNGTPFLNHSAFSASLLPSLRDISSGDGSYCFTSGAFIYSSVQNGGLVFSNLETGAESRFFAFLQRDDLTRFFIHPFTVDPNDAGTLFYGSNGDGIIARNDQFDEASVGSSFDGDLINNSWFDAALNESVAITALKVTDLNPSHKLYFGGSFQDNTVLYSWSDANTTDGSAITSRVLSEVSSGGWLTDIAVNAKNGQELILVYSNYNIDGLYYSNDGGASFESIEGNLGANDELGSAGITGPSLRAAEIVEDQDGTKKIFVATSIGLYSTLALNGPSTVWSLETPELDNIVVEDLDHRTSDGAIAVGTHGRGAFMGLPNSTNTNSNPIIENQSFTVNENAVNGNVFGTITATDADAGTLAFSITSGNDNGYFALQSTGELSVSDGSGLDFEVTSSFDLGVTVEDGQGGSASATMNVTLLDVNEAPVMITQNFQIEENSSNGTLIGTIDADDPENDQLTYTLISGNGAGAFALSATGTLTVNDELELDFETINRFILAVSVSDGALSDDAEIVIDVTNVDEVEPLGVATAELNVYPNPFIDHISVEGKMEVDGYEVVDVSGRVLMQGALKGSPTIDLSVLSSGLYFLRVDNQTVRIQKR